MGIGRSCDHGTRLVIIVIAARVKPRVENEPNVTCAGDAVAVSHTCSYVQTPGCILDAKRWNRERTDKCKGATSSTINRAKISRFD